MSAGEGDPPEGGVELSVILAVRRDEHDPAACVAALEPQLRPGVELLVVDSGPRPSDPADSTDVLHLEDGLVPELWAEGVRAARGRLVALTAASVVVGPDFVDQTLAAHDAGEAVVGGPIEAAAGLGAVDRAVYLCRFSPYQLPLRAGRTPEIAGDNASYDAGLLHAHADLYADGFWEPFIHKVLRDEGGQLELRAERPVRYVGGVSAGTFSAHRFRHGRIFGRERAEGHPRRKVLIDIVTAPLVPFVMSARVVGEAAARRRVLTVAPVLPIVLWFYVCWASGEVVGRIATLRR